MKIETKFNVNDLTQKKYDRDSDGVMVCEISEIRPVVCIAGTQVVYLIRPILLTKIKHYGKDIPKYEWNVDRLITKDNTFPQFREDELIPISDEYRKIVLGK